MSNQDIWILEAKRRELTNAILILEDLKKDSTIDADSRILAEAIRRFNHRHLELLAEQEKSEAEFYGWHEKEEK